MDILSNWKGSTTLLTLMTGCQNVTIAPSGESVNKYSKEANQPNESDAVNVGDKDSWKSVDKPFRLAKINLIWAKAQKRLTEFKLKTLYSELKVQDKEELQLKRLKADNMDKDGLLEADLRRKFGSIIERYGLGDHFDKDLIDTESNKADSTTNSHSLFKDKKLNKLWLKAESAGFTETELKTLKEEFIHHQEKVLQFYSLLEEHNSRKLREERPKSRDFEEPKVQGLWKIALKGDFTSEELESLRTELRHYEQRLQKLHVRHRHDFDSRIRLGSRTTTGFICKSFQSQKKQGKVRNAVQSNSNHGRLMHLRKKDLNTFGRLLSCRHDRCYLWNSNIALDSTFITFFSAGILNAPDRLKRKYYKVRKPKDLFEVRLTER
nr:EOG090X09CU [Ceriodaphnia reticulata]